MGIYRQGKTFWVNKCIAGVRYYESAGTTSKMEAKAFYDRWVYELKEQIRTGKPIFKQEPAPEQKKEITFSELSKLYLEYINGRLRSYPSQKVLIKKLLQTFGNIKLNVINISLIEKMQSNIIANDLSAAYANRLTATIKRMFAKALDWNLIPESGLKEIQKVKLLKGEIKRLRYLTEDEQERLINVCNKEIKPIVITALNTGMRKSEILHLTWDRVDLENRIILLDKTKNGERREIPINQTLLNTLSGIVRNIKTDYVFYNPETLKPYCDIKKSWQRALAKTHILDFRFHDLRHTFASSLVMKGVDLATVKELLGHKDIKMTLRYSHLSQAHVKQAVSVLDKKCYNSVIAGENDILSKS